MSRKISRRVSSRKGPPFQAGIHDVYFIKMGKVKMKETMITDEIYSDYFQALLAGEKGKCIETVNGLLEKRITL